jgi:hypothetical protein
MARSAGVVESAISPAFFKNLTALSLIRGRIFQTGDETLVRLVKNLPDESWARLRDILAVRA